MIQSAQKESDLHQSTDPPAPPPSAELVLKTQTDNTVTTQSAENKVVFCQFIDLNFFLFLMQEVHSTDPPAPPLHAEHVTTGKTTSVNVSTEFDKVF